MKIESEQVAVVTVSTSGIGFGLAAVLARRGVNVVIADVSVDADVDALADDDCAR